MRDVALSLIFLMGSQAMAQVAETIGNLSNSHCVYSGSVSGELRKSAYGKSPLSGRVQIETSTRSSGNERRVSFDMNAVIDADSLNAKILLKVAEGATYDANKGHLQKLSVIYDLSAKKFLFTKNIQHDEYEALVQQNSSQTQVTTRGNNANGIATFNVVGLVSSTFPVFQLAKFAKEALQIIPVLKFLRVNGVIKPLVVNQEVTIANIPSQNADAQMIAPLAIYGMVSNGPVKVLIDQRTQQLRQIYMRIGNENKETEPLDFEITANLGAGTCK